MTESAAVSRDLPLGARIREARQEARVTNAELAELVGVDVRTVAGWQAKKPRSRPSYERLVLIAQKLAKPVSFFLEEAA
jgi:transcriptional regulator with XRE-family HTH domain